MISPLKLIAAFQRCQNYPKDDFGVQALVQGLATASRETGVQMQDITERCAKISQYCPTDADFLNVARDILADRKRAEEADVERTKRAAWERDCGPAKQFNWSDAVDPKRVREVAERRTRMFREIKQLLHLPTGKWAAPDDMWAAAERLGYHDYAYCWRRSAPPGGNDWRGQIPEDVLAKCSGPGVIRNHAMPVF
jgi:hypothetical protein